MAERRCRSIITSYQSIVVADHHHRLMDCYWETQEHQLGRHQPAQRDGSSDVISVHYGAANMIYSADAPLVPAPSICCVE